MELSTIFPLGQYIFDNFFYVYLASLTLIAVFSLIAFRGTSIAFGLPISCVALASSMSGSMQVACPLFIVGLFLFYIYKPTDNFLENNSTHSRWLIAVTFIAFIIGIFLRTAQLDLIPGSFEGELAPYMAAASSIKGSFYANKGVNGPWAPLGILYYLPIYLCYKLFDISLWSVRFSSAIVGIFTIVVLFFASKRIFNLKIALVSTCIFSLNYLHIGWSRTDVHPHGVTAWPALLVLLTTFLFFEKKSLDKLRAIFLIFAMALSWHQYPSGQSAVAIPFITTIILLISGSVKTRQLKYILPTLTVGAIFWYLGLPLSYYLADGRWDFLNPFTLTTVRASWGNTSEHINTLDKVLFVVNQSFRYLLLFLDSLVHKTTYIHHQDYLAFIPNTHPRTYAFFLIPFTLLGLSQTIKNCGQPRFAALIGILFAALAPGILSESPVPKRLSVTFLVLDIISSVGLVTSIELLYQSNRKLSYKLFNIIFAGFVLFGSCFHVFGFLSGNQYTKHIPIELTLAKTIQGELKSNTLILAHLPKDYDLGKIIFLLLDDLFDQRNQPIFFSITNSFEQLKSYANNPQFALQDEKKFRISWIYQWTKLRDIFDNLDPNNSWSRIVFLLQYQKDQEPQTDFENRIKLIQDLCAAKINRISSTKILEAELSFQNPIALITCEQK